MSFLDLAATLNMTPISSAPLNQPSALPSSDYQNGSDSDSLTSESNYNYNDLKLETRKLVRQRTNEIQNLILQTTQNTIKIGQWLLEVKEQLEHGQFHKWLKAEFGWGMTTAWKLMKVGESFKYSQCEYLDIAPSALYLLATPSTSPAARVEAIERAGDGETITLAKAKTIIDKHKELAKPKATSLVSARADSSPAIKHQLPIATTSTKPAILPDQPDQVKEDEDEDEEVDQDYSPNYDNAIRTQPSMDWQEGDFCQWQGKTGQILEIQGDEAIVDFFPPENARKVRLAELQLPALAQHPDSTHVLDGEDAALNAKEDNVIDEARSQAQAMSSTPNLNEPVNIINDSQFKPVEQQPIYSNGTKAMCDELTIDVDAIAVELKADDNYSALSQVQAILVSLVADYSDKPLEEMSFLEVDKLLKQIICNLNFSAITGPDYLSDDHIAEIWRAIAPRISAARRVEHLAQEQVVEVLQQLKLDRNS